MRNLVVCCDGTWNTAEQEQAGVPIPTNVVRLYNAVAPTNGNGIEQIKYYHPGVGTEGGWWERLAGGAIGIGLDKNIMSAYRWLGTAYQAGDNIHLFGFSRGAFTVRSLAGMIAKCGLLDLRGVADDEVWRRVADAYHEGYRVKAAKRADWAGDWPFHEDEAGQPVETTFFLGVWDTVGALGVPDDLAIFNLIDDPQRFAFHDTKLSERVEHARHAVALDEHRASFTPTLWQTGAHADLKQIWFPGVHSDVGGGYPETGLSNGALDWMMEEADAQGLAFHPGMREQVRRGRNPRDVLHRSDTGAFELLQTQPRSVPPIEKKGVPHHLHPSVLERRDDPPITQAPYRPTSVLAAGEQAVVDVFAREPWNQTGLYFEQGGRYEFAATGQWLDRDIPSGPDGKGDGDFHAGEIVRFAATLWGKAETAFRKLTDNELADFKGTRRREDMPWFALVGVIANGGNPRADGTPEPHETFEIGAGGTHTAAKAGYFYAYANDAWHFYDNNRGSVSLTVKRLS